MPKLRVHAFTISLDGYAAGPDQDLANPLGVGGGGGGGGRPWGAWPDERWKGWWGDTPPYHTPVFVLTHHPRASIVMDGGTTFHFITDGIYPALERAVEAANGQDVRLGGGIATIRHICAQVSSTSCTSRFRPSCSAPANTYSPIST